jgi:hypothetical protein
MQLVRELAISCHIMEKMSSTPKTASLLVTVKVAAALLRNIYEEKSLFTIKC